MHFWDDDTKISNFIAPIRCQKYKIISIIKCPCGLHNFIKRRDDDSYAVHTIEDNQNFAPINMRIVGENFNIDIS